LVDAFFALVVRNYAGSAFIERPVRSVAFGSTTMNKDRIDDNGVDADILVASPDEALLGRLASSLAALGVEVEPVPSTAGAIERLREKRYQLALIDVDGMVGDVSDVLSNMREISPDLIVLVMATEPTRRLLLDLIHTKIYDFFPKPINTARLCGTVEFLLGSRIHDQDRDPGSSETREADVSQQPNLTSMSREIFRSNQELQSLNVTLRRQVSQLTILYQMGRDISENENWSDALDRFLMALVNYIGAEGAALLLFSEHESKLSTRSNFQIDPSILSQSCQVLLENWRDNPRGNEVHPIESYRDTVISTCLDRRRPWRFTMVPLRHRNRSLGFLFIDKPYGSGHVFRRDYHFLNALQTILAEEVTNAAYISELRQLSRFNHKVLDNIKSGVITTDLNGNIRFHNEQAVAHCPRIAGQTTVHFNDLFESEAFGGDFYQRVLESKKDTHILNVHYKREADKRFPARLSLTKMHDDNLNGTVLVSIFEDLTEQKQLEAEIRRNDRLRVLGQLSAGVAHEIRNPLTGIATTAEVLGSKIQGDPEKSKYIRVIMEETDRLNEIIRNLLNFARPTKPQIKNFALIELSKRVATLLTDEARKKGVDLNVENRLTHESCNADINQLTQVLMNLVLNSIQACEAGDEVKIVMKNEESQETKSDSFARIDVIDSGVGVPAEVRRSLFEPFVTTKTHGTGLGLAISQQIVEEHHGKISCEFLDHGTCFTIKLPVGRQHAASKGGRS